MEVLGAQRFRTQVKRRKAAQAGKMSYSIEARYLSVACDVVATGSKRILYVLPEAFCRVPKGKTDGRP